MRIILTDEEVKKASLKAMLEKLNLSDKPDIDGCYLVVYDENNKEINQSCKVEFVYDNEL